MAITGAHSHLLPRTWSGGRRRRSRAATTSRPAWATPLTTRPTRWRVVSPRHPSSGHGSAIPHDLSAPAMRSMVRLPSRPSAVQVGSGTCRVPRRPDVTLRAPHTGRIRQVAGPAAWNRRLRRFPVVPGALACTHPWRSAARAQEWRADDSVLGADSEIRAENWRAWDFSIVDRDGTEIGRIDKKSSVS